VPREEPLVSERLLVVARGVEHHLNDAFDVAVHRDEAGDIDPQTPRDRRADLIRIEAL